MADFIPFPAQWVTGVTSRLPPFDADDVNPWQVATWDTASRLAALLRGTVVEDPLSLKLSHPIYVILTPQGARLNAGLLAQQFNRYGAQPGSLAWLQYEAEAGLTAPVFNTIPSPGEAPKPGHTAPPPPPPGTVPISSRPATPPPATLPPGAAVTPTQPGGTPKLPAGIPPTIRYDVERKFIGAGAAPIGGALGPPGWIALAVGTILTGLFAIFGGGVSKEVKRALEGLRESQFKMGDALMRFSWSGFFGFGWLLRAVQNLWVRILHPLLDSFGKLIRWADRVFDRVLKPYLRLINKIRLQLLQLYEQYVRPVLEAIQTVRKILAVFRIAGFKWAVALDNALADIQGRIAGAVALVFRQLSELARWQNVLLTWRLILQQPIFVNSMHAYAQIAALQFWNAHLAKPTSGALAGAAPQSERVTTSDSLARLRVYARTGQAPYAKQIREAHDRLRAGIVR